jgi:hypothetical protein
VVDGAEVAEKAEAAAEEEESGGMTEEQLAGLRSTRGDRWIDIKKETANDVRNWESDSDPRERDEVHFDSGYDSRERDEVY